MSDATEPMPTAPPRPRRSPVEGAIRPTPVARAKVAPEPRHVETGSAASWSTLWLTDRDIAVFTVLGAVLLVLLTARWGQLSGWGLHEVEIERLTPLEQSFRLDLNAATWVEFAQLDGVGETLALRIVEYREKNGPFGDVAELDEVEGIGPKTLERLRPYLRVEMNGSAQK